MNQLALIAASPILPALTVDASELVALHYLAFFAARIRNPSARTKVYDRRREELSLGAVERIRVRAVAVTT